MAAILPSHSQPLLSAASPGSRKKRRLAPNTRESSFKEAIKTLRDQLRRLTDARVPASRKPTDYLEFNVISTALDDAQTHLERKDVRGARLVENYIQRARSALHPDSPWTPTQTFIQQQITRLSAQLKEITAKAPQNSDPMHFAEYRRVALKIKEASELASSADVRNVYLADRLCDEIPPLLDQLRTLPRWTLTIETLSSFIADARKSLDARACELKCFEFNCRNPEHFKEYLELTESLSELETALKNKELPRLCPLYFVAYQCLSEALTHDWTPIRDVPPR